MNGVSQWLEELIQPAVEEHEDKEDSTQELIVSIVVGGKYNFPKPRSQIHHTLPCDSKPCRLFT